jgi:hypothetical protein
MPEGKNEKNISNFCPISVISVPDMNNNRLN